MQILITGGAGFIGKSLTLKLLKEGYSVVVIDNFITSNRKDFQKFLRIKNLTFFEGSIIEPKLIKKIQNKYQFDQIYHLACPTGIPNLSKLAYEMLMACSIGTKNILDVARDQKASLVFTSSSEVYGDPQVFPQDESYTGNVDPVGLRSPYEEGKRFSESLVRMYCNKFGVKGKIVRVFNTYGPFMDINDTRVIPRFIQSALAEKALPVKGRGTQRRTFCFVADLITGLQRVLEKGENGEVYNLGTDEEISIINLANLVVKLSGSKSKIKFVKREVHDHKARLPDLKKIKKLGWEWKVNLKEGLEKTLESI